MEFSIAMKLIKLKLQGYQLPSALPPVMKQQPGAMASAPAFGELEREWDPVVRRAVCRHVSLPLAASSTVQAPEVALSEGMVAGRKEVLGEERAPAAAPGPARR